MKACTYIVYVSDFCEVWTVSSTGFVKSNIETPLSASCSLMVTSVPSKVKRGMRNLSFMMEGSQTSTTLSPTTSPATFCDSKALSAATNSIVSNFGSAFGRVASSSAFSLLSNSSPSNFRRAFIAAISALRFAKASLAEANSSFFFFIASLAFSLFSIRV